jgi:hypothetical protein
MYDSWFCPSRFLQANDIYIDNLPMHCVKPDSTNLCVLVVTILTMLKCNISFWIDNTTQCCFYFSTFSSISWNQGCVNLHGLWWQPLPQCKEAKPVQNQVPLAVLMPQMPMPPFGSIFFCVVLVWEVTFVQCSTLLRVSKPYYRWTFLLVPLNNLVSTFRTRGRGHSVWKKNQLRWNCISIHYNYVKWAYNSWWNLPTS